MRLRISSEERFEILATKSPYGELMLSGVFSSLAICVMALLVIMLLSLITDIINMNSVSMQVGMILKKILPYSVVMVFVGVLASRFKKYEYAKSGRFPLVYPLLVAAIFLVSITELTILISVKNEYTSKLLEILNFEEINITFWFAMCIFILFLSFMLGNPVETLWVGFYRFFLARFSSVDYRAAYNEQHFFAQLSELFYNAQRYQTVFSVIVFRLTNYPELKKRFRKKRLLEIHDELLEHLNDNIRKTDVSGYIKEGETFCIILQANKAQTDMIAQRIIARIEESFADKYKEKIIALNARKWEYTPNWKTVEDLIKDIVKDADVEEKPQFLRM